MQNIETEEVSPLLGKALARSITFDEIERVAGGEFSASQVETNIVLTNCHRSISYDCDGIDAAD